MYKFIFADEFVKMLPDEEIPSCVAGQGSLQAVLDWTFYCDVRHTGERGYPAFWEAIDDYGNLVSCCAV